MRDLQNEREGFPPRPLQSVGVEGIKDVMSIARADGSIVKVLAAFSAVCPLPATQRGLNMSRTGRAIHAFLQETAASGVSSLLPLAKRLMLSHEAQGAKVSASFDYPFAVKSPVTHTEGTKVCQVVMQSEAGSRESPAYSTLTVKTSEMSLCPCSKEMSLLENNLSPDEASALSSLPPPLKAKLCTFGRGAHNQIVDIEAAIDVCPAPPSIEELCAALSSCASALTYPVLKREDEKYTTERAWDNPRFVEDIVRLAGDKLHGMGFTRYSVTATSHESIHSGGITAVATLSRPQGS